MEFAIFVAGVVVGYFIEKALDIVVGQIHLLWKRRLWKKAERIWKKYESLSFGLEVVQTGWKDCSFSEDHIVADDTYKMADDIGRLLDGLTG